jgi:hypothetical protein
MEQVVLFYDKTDPLKLGFGAILIIGSLFLGYRKTTFNEGENNESSRT